jgi:hypothetical protein
MARTSKPASPPKATPRTPKTSRQPAKAAAPDVVPTAAALASAAFEWPLSPLKYLGPWLERVQRINEHAMKGLSVDTDLGREDLRRAESPSELLGYQMEFMSSQLARWTMINEEIMAGLLDVQALWMRDFEALAAKQMRGWLGAEARKPVRSAEAVFELPNAATPADMLTAMQRAQTEIGKVWLRTLRHDLQASPPVTAAA